MFLHTVSIERLSPDGEPCPVPVYHLDSFAMRNFTNDAIFDDTLPVSDGRLEVGSLVPLHRLHAAIEQWFRRKLYLRPGEALRVTRLR